MYIKYVDNYSDCTISLVMNEKNKWLSYSYFTYVDQDFITGSPSISFLFLLSLAVCCTTFVYYNSYAQNPTIFFKVLPDLLTYYFKIL